MRNLVKTLESADMTDKVAASFDGGRLTYEVPTNLPRPRDEIATRETDRYLQFRPLLTTALNRDEDQDPQ